MTQERKELLLKDLCSRLPYGVKVKIKYYDGVWKLLAIYTNGTTYATRDVGYPIETYFEDCKPYLFPLSSMTEEQRNEYNNLCAIGTDECGDIVYFDTYESIDYLYKIHVDVKNLIPKGHAIDATNLNIY